MKNFIFVSVFAALCFGVAALAGPDSPPTVPVYQPYDFKADVTLRQGLNIPSTGSQVDGGAWLNVGSTLGVLQGMPIVVSQGMDAGLFVSTLVFGRAVVGVDAGITVNFGTTFSVVPRCVCTSNNAACFKINATTSAVAFGGTAGDILDAVCVGER